MMDKVAAHKFPDLLECEPADKPKPRPFIKWDWQCFLFGFSFERGPRWYVVVNVGFVCLYIAHDRWDPWF
jgi:hypothetical protein